MLKKCCDIDFKKVQFGDLDIRLYFWKIKDSDICRLYNKSFFYIMFYRGNNFILLKELQKFQFLLMLRVLVLLGMKFIQV